MSPAMLKSLITFAKLKIKTNKQTSKTVPNWQSAKLIVQKLSLILDMSILKTNLIVAMADE